MVNCKGCGAGLGHSLACEYCLLVNAPEVPAEGSFAQALTAAMGGRYQFGWTDHRAVYVGSPPTGPIEPGRR